MQDQLRERIIAFLLQNWVGILSATGPDGIWAMPVRYRSQALTVECLVPRWAEVNYHLEQPNSVVLVIAAVTQANQQQWLRYQGLAQITDTGDWAELLPPDVPLALANDLYQVIRLNPQRLDLMDEQRGWGARETLE